MTCLAYAKERNETAWAWISTVFCMIWDAVTTVLNVVIVSLESILGFVLSAVTAIVEVIQMIPVLGTIVRWALNAITNVFFIAVSLPDLLLGAIGIRPEKKLRVCTVILRDENGAPVCTPEAAVHLLQNAANMYKRDANVRLVPSRPFFYATGFAGADTVDATWVQTDSANGDKDVLDIPCEAAGAGVDWLLTGGKLQQKAIMHGFYGIWRRVTGYGAPITCFVIRDVVGSPDGCALWITDYVTVEGAASVSHPDPRVLGHEVGHATGLLHRCVDDDVRNIMGNYGTCDPPSATSPDAINPRLSDWQALVVRTSKHVTYF